jgi:hypothetical protein
MRSKPCGHRHWEFSGVGNFSSVLVESDLILRDSNTGALQIYDINNNRLTGSVSVGAGLDLNGDEDRNLPLCARLIIRVRRVCRHG